MFCHNRAKRPLRWTSTFAVPLRPRKPRSVLIRFLLGAAILTASLPAVAASLHDAFEAAAVLSAELRSLDARRAEIDARMRRANAWTPGAPSVGVGYTTDRPTHNRGYQEIEVELAVPVWLPGQARAQRGLAATETRRLAAQIAAQRLMLAGEVREAYWAWAAADAAVAAAQARSSSATALAQDAGRQARGGQVPLADSLIATADARESASALREAQATLRDSRLAFRALTGREPAAGWAEVPRDGDAPSQHPRIVAAQLGIDIGRANLRIAQVEDRDNPEIGVFGRQERDSSDSRWDARVGVRVRFPFAHPPRNAERRAAAQGEIVTATAEGESAERTLAAERERSRSALADTRAAAELAEQRFRALHQAASLGERAFRQGQATLADALRLRALLAAADAERRRTDVARRHAVSRYNQAIGVEP